MNHSDALDPGQRLPYSNGEFVSSCTCGRTFGSTEWGDPDTAEAMLMVHMDSPDLTLDQIKAEMGWLGVE